MWEYIDSVTARSAAHGGDDPRPRDPDDDRWEPDDTEPGIEMIPTLGGEIILCPEEFTDLNSDGPAHVSTDAWLQANASAFIDLQEVQ